MANFDNIGAAAISVLQTEDARAKAEQARIVAAAWRSEAVPFQFDLEPPERPARPAKPELLDPSKMPNRGKAGNDVNRRALLHAIAHIELNAIDLAFDMIARFGGMMPRRFTDDWISVGEDEARHFTLLTGRMKSMQTRYGDMPAHDGLWQSAMDTAHALPARLAIVPMVLEARGLDVTPRMISQFKQAGDPDSVRVLEVIYKEEIKHVAIGARWFKYLAEKSEQNAEAWFHELVEIFFKGKIKGPFNHEARERAGLGISFYGPLALAAKDQ
ncbi:MAG: ferritin-like domain-containing protein [Kordiimonadaceae bacterium]|nr:ferritin-like domain-containing protein [Kordiimonadaceae bacterium]